MIKREGRIWDSAGRLHIDSRGGCQVGCHSGSLESLFQQVSLPEFWLVWCGLFFLERLVPDQIISTRVEDRAKAVGDGCGSEKAGSELGLWDLNLECGRVPSEKHIKNAFFFYIKSK